MAKANEMLASSTYKLSYLIDDISDLTAIDRGEFQVVETEFRIQEIKDFIFKLFSLECKGKKMNLDVYFSRSLADDIISSDKK